MHSLQRNPNTHERKKELYDLLFCEKWERFDEVGSTKKRQKEREVTKLSEKKSMYIIEFMIAS